MLARRLPKRGFHNVFAKNYAEINVGYLNIFEDGAVVTFEALCELGLAQKKYDGIRVLGNGELTKKFTVKVPCSASAKAKILAAGGEVKELLADEEPAANEE